MYKKVDKSCSKVHTVKTRYLLIESCNPLEQVGVLMQTQVINVLLNATQHLRKRRSTVVTRVQRLHFEIDLFLDSNEVVDTLLEQEDGLGEFLDVRIKLVRVPHELNTFSDHCLDVASHASHQQRYARTLLYLPITFTFSVPYAIRMTAARSTNTIMSLYETVITMQMETVGILCDIISHNRATS